MLSLTGDLAALKNQVFVLKEGIEYKVKITFKVRAAAGGSQPCPSLPEKALNILLPPGQQGDCQWPQMSASHLSSGTTW